VNANGVYAAGSFSSFGGQPRAFLAAFDPSTGALLGWNPGASTRPEALTHVGSTIYIGGNFTLLGGQTRRGLGAVDANGAVTTWAPTLGFPTSASPVVFLRAIGANLHIGGGFSLVNGENIPTYVPLDRVTGLRVW
jgi:hypothetical protein